DTQRPEQEARGGAGHQGPRQCGGCDRALGLRIVARWAAQTGDASPGRGRKPRPEGLAKALDDPELVAARNNPIFKQPNADPQEVLDAKEALNKLEPRRAEVMKGFAALHTLDKTITDDPKRAQEFTEKAVADMFGDDKLGRELGT